MIIPFVPPPPMMPIHGGPLPPLQSIPLLVRIIAALVFSGLAIAAIALFVDTAKDGIREAEDIAVVSLVASITLVGVALACFFIYSCFV